jgi:DNA-binding MarR family transcriptional regulator
MIKFQFELDPRKVEEFIRPLPARQRLVYRLAVRGLCLRCRGDRQSRQRTDVLTERFRKDLAAVIKEADKLSAELTASVSGR